MRTKKIAYIRNERVYGFVVWIEKTNTQPLKDISAPEIIPKKILEVLFLYIQKDNRAQIGAQIIRDLELYAKENKFHVITLIPDDNLIEFYEHFGFSIYALDMFDNKPKMRKKINKGTRSERSPERAMPPGERSSPRGISVKKIRCESQTKYYNEILPKELQNESNYESLDKFFSED